MSFLWRQVADWLGGQCPSHLCDLEQGLCFCFLICRMDVMIRLDTSQGTLQVFTDTFHFKYLAQCLATHSNYNHHFIIAINIIITTSPTLSHHCPHLLSEPQGQRFSYNPVSISGIMGKYHPISKFASMYELFIFRQLFSQTVKSPTPAGLELKQFPQASLLSLCLGNK